jgi:hypothetical protein
MDRAPPPTLSARHPIEQGQCSRDQPGSLLTAGIFPNSQPDLRLAIWGKRRVPGGGLASGFSAGLPPVGEVPATDSLILNCRPKGWARQAHKADSRGRPI